MNLTKKQIITIVVILGILVASISTFAFVSNQKTSKANLAQINTSSSTSSSIVINSSSTSSKTTKDNSSQVQVINLSSSLISSSSSISKSSSQSTTSKPIIPTCNLPDSPNLVKTEDGCFEVAWSVGDSDIFKRPEYPDNINKNFLYKNDSNLSMLKKIAIDYHKKVKLYFMDENSQIWFSDSKKNSNMSFYITISFLDKKYNESNNFKGIYPRLTSTYQISEQPDGSWGYKFLEFVKDSNGKMINE